jgi:hypothetical protein
VQNNASKYLNLSPKSVRADRSWEKAKEDLNFSPLSKRQRDGLCTCKERARETGLPMSEFSQPGHI